MIYQVFNEAGNDWYKSPYAKQCQKIIEDETNKLSQSYTTPCNPKEKIPLGIIAKVKFTFDLIGERFLGTTTLTRLELPLNEYDSEYLKGSKFSEHQVARLSGIVREYSETKQDSDSVCVLQSFQSTMEGDVMVSKTLKIEYLPAKHVDHRLIQIVEAALLNKDTLNDFQNPVIQLLNRTGELYFERDDIK